MKLLIVFFISISLPLTSEIYDLQKDGYEQYQDIYLNGKVIKKASNHERYEEKRFQILDSILSLYTRPFTMLDVGASQGYFTFRSAEKYPDSVFVMLEGSNNYYPKISKQLHSICQENKTCKNIIWLDQSISPEDFVHLSKCEHFDVILAQNILHWFPNKWQSLLKSFLKMSHVLILELPPNESTLSAEQQSLRENLHKHLASQATQILEGVPRHTNPQVKTTYYIFINEKGPSTLEKTSLIHPDFGDRKHRISFDFHEKYLIKTDVHPPHTIFTEKWTPGINLITYLSMNGQCPSRKDLANALPIDPDHKDWMPNNMIVQGHNITLIDKNDPKNDSGGQNLCSDVRIQRLKELILNLDKKNTSSINLFLQGNSK